MGGFYSSLLCQLLPEGIGRSIARARCPKVFVPSMGRDPEVIESSMSRLVEQLLSAIQADAPDAAVEDMLNVVLIDSKDGSYDMNPGKERIHELGVDIADVTLAGEDGWICPDKLSAILLSMV